MPINTIAETYPNIYGYHNEVGGPWGRMEQLYEDVNLSLPALDAALATVGRPQSAVLRGLATDLFSDDIDKVLAAICEFLAFGWLMNHASLASTDIGYPANWLGEDPPFEGVLRPLGVEIAFDVKDGSGSGMRLLRDLLQRQVDTHVAGVGVAPTVHLALNAPTGQRWVNENFAGIVGPFRQEIRTNGLTSRILEFRAGSGRIRVGIDCQVGASIAGRREKASFVSRQIVDHAQHKAGQLQRTTATSFALVYVRRPGSGLSDFDDGIMRDAANYLAGRGDLPDTFCGVIFLDFDHTNGGSTPHALCWDRSLALGAMLGDVVSTHTATPTVMPEVRMAAARHLNAVELVPTSVVMMGSCDLRGQNCLASGSTGSVYAYFHQDEQYLSCFKCMVEFGWPAPSGM